MSHHVADIPRGRRLQAVVTALAFALFPYASFLSDNVGEQLDLGVLSIYAAVTVAAALAAVGTAARLRGDAAAQRTAVVVAGVCLAIFNYNHLQSGIERVGTGDTFAERAAIWVAVLACAAGGAFVASRYNLARSYALFAGLALLLIPLGSYAVSASGARSGALEIEKSPVGTATGLDREFPNIYLVVPDGYARADHLERLTQYDNEGFLRQLEERGFHVARHATSNYTVTGMSMASMLDTSYVVQEESGNSEREALNRYIAGDNATLRRLRELGYRYVAAPAGGYEDELCAGVEDLCVAPLEVPGTVRAFTETEVAFLEKTPLGDVIREFLAGKISRPYADPSHVVETVHASALPSPYFVLVHMLQPHPPFQFGPDCAVQQTIDPSLTWWGPKSDSMERGLYVGSLQCVNKMLLAAADKVARDDPTAIIAIQSDHGTPYTVDWHKRPSEWEQDAIAERLGILSALRMPRSCDAGDDERTAVNSLRHVLACVEGGEPDPLPVKHYIHTFRYKGVELLTDPARQP